VCLSSSILCYSMWFLCFVLFLVVGA
jgi:hypothetical protein